MHISIPETEHYLRFVRAGVCSNTGSNTGNNTDPIYVYARAGTKYLIAEVTPDGPGRRIDIPKGTADTVLRADGEMLIIGNVIKKSTIYNGSKKIIYTLEIYVYKFNFSRGLHTEVAAISFVISADYTDFKLRDIMYSGGNILFIYDFSIGDRSGKRIAIINPEIIGSIPQLYDVSAARIDGGTCTFIYRENLCTYSGEFKTIAQLRISGKYKLNDFSKVIGAECIILNLAAGYHVIFNEPDGSRDIACGYSTVCMNIRASRAIHVYRNTGVIITENTYTRGNYCYTGRGNTCILASLSRDELEAGAIHIMPYEIDDIAADSAAEYYIVGGDIMII